MLAKVNNVLAILNRKADETNIVKTIKKCTLCKNCNKYSCDNEFDYCNFKKSRNFNNVELSDYNCGGFALNTLNWFMPNCNICNILDCVNVETLIAEKMVNSFDGTLRIVDKLEDVQIDEYAILFRFEMPVDISLIKECECEECENYYEVEFCNNCSKLKECEISMYLGDFHFIREFEGVWLHKPGGQEIEEISFEHIFNYWSSSKRSEPYKGDIVIMAMKKTRDLLLKEVI